MMTGVASVLRRSFVQAQRARYMKRSVKLLVLLFLSSALLAGCNTARGVGEDIQGLGHAISHAVS